MSLKDYTARKRAVVVALISIGESRIAQDFAECEGKEAFVNCEHVLRQMMKRSGPDEPFRAQVLANAIYEAQLLPSHLCR